MLTFQFLKIKWDNEFKSKETNEPCALPWAGSRQTQSGILFRTLSQKRVFSKGTLTSPWGICSASLASTRCWAGRCGSRSARGNICNDEAYELVSRSKKRILYCFCCHLKFGFFKLYLVLLVSVHNGVPIPGM